MPLISNPYRPAAPRTLFSLALLLKRVLTLLLITGLPATATAHGPAREVAESERVISFPDTQEYKTLTVDLHTHSVFSDGHVWPKIRVEEALRDGLHALAITEHLEYQPHLADIAHADRNRAYEIALAAANATDLIIIPGSEITREEPAGHINAVFLTDANALINVENPPEDASDTLGYYNAANLWPAQAAVDAAAEQGAFIFWNHPYWTRQAPDGIARMNDFHAANIRADKLHGIEIANGQSYSEEAHAIALKHDLALIGVSDVHDLIDWDHPPHQGEHRPVTLVLAQTASTEGIRDALFARRTVVWFRNLLIGRPEHLLPLIDASLQISDASWLPETHVLKVTISNSSDARFELRNTTKMTFMDHADLLTIPPHGDLTFMVKPGKKVERIGLEFEVRNALSAPKTHPTLRLSRNIP